MPIIPHRVVRSRYFKKVLSFAPIAYWPQWEGTGATAQCLVNRAQDGAYTGVTLAQPGIGDGRTSPYYDGVNDYTNIYSAAFNAAFNGATGTALVWARVANAGAWTDGVNRECLRLWAQVGNSLIYLRKTNANNQLEYNYTANGTLEQVLVNGVTETGWMTFALTWDATALPTGEVRAYLFWNNGANGGQQGATQVGLGVWAGVLSATGTVIGAATTVPNAPWSGWVAHVPIWDRVLSLADLQDLATV